MRMYTSYCKYECYKCIYLYSDKSNGKSSRSMVITLPKFSFMSCTNKEGNTNDHAEKNTNLIKTSSQLAKSQVFPAYRSRREMGVTVVAEENQGVTLNTTYKEPVDGTNNIYVYKIC